MSRLFLMMCCLIFSQFTFAEVHLDLGDSVTKGGETIYCGSQGSGSGSSSNDTVTGKTCQKYDIYGKCISYDEETITGRYCAEGEVCQKYDIYGKCISYDTVTECGNNGCSTSKECQKYDIYGKCISYDTKVSCH